MEGVAVSRGVAAAMSSLAPEHDPKLDSTIVCREAWTTLLITMTACKPLLVCDVHKSKVQLLTRRAWRKGNSQGRTFLRFNQQPEHANHTRRILMWRPLTSLNLRRPTANSGLEVMDADRTVESGLLIAHTSSERGRRANRLASRPDRLNAVSRLSTQALSTGGSKSAAASATRTPAVPCCRRAAMRCLSMFGVESEGGSRKAADRMAGDRASRKRASIAPSARRGDIGSAPSAVGAGVGSTKRRRRSAN
eukprot:scaffold299279_cov39-Tisochrysis_lutea.AAC.7